LNCPSLCANVRLGVALRRGVHAVSMPELYEAFVDGRVSRGAFIRRLVAFGISVPVAAAYAAAIKPDRASAADAEIPDLYDLYHGPPF
jgi:hypothetical protein